MVLSHAAGEREQAGERQLESQMPEMRSRAQKDIGLDPEGCRKPWKDFKSRMICILESRKWIRGGSLEAGMYPWHYNTVDWARDDGGLHQGQGVGRRRAQGSRDEMVGAGFKGKGVGFTSLGVPSPGMLRK